MLTSITVRGFKSLEQVEVPLGCVNVFIGANGSGKSNLLEALGFVSAVAEGRLDDQALARRGVRTSAPALYRSSFAKTQPVTETRIETRFDTPDCQLDYTLRLLMETDERERRGHLLRHAWCAIQIVRLSFMNVTLAYRACSQRRHWRTE